MQRSNLLALLAVLAIGGIALAMTGTAGAATSAEPASSNNSVGAGEQLSTILATAEDDLRSDIDETAVEIEYEQEDESERAETLSERAGELRERADDVREEQEELAEEYEEGDLSQSHYAQQLAILNNRAANIQSSLQALDNRSARVSPFELRAAGLQQETLENVTSELENVTGTGPATLLQQFTGQQDGEFEIDVSDGMSIEAESEDGERSREIRRPGDGDDSMVISQAAAEETARSELSSQAGNWTMTEASAHDDSGYYEFEFALDEQSADGEAEIRVDASSGEVLRIEEEIEAADDEEDDDEREDEGEDEREDGEDDDEREDEDEDEREDGEDDDEREEEDEDEEEDEREDEDEAAGYMPSDDSIAQAVNLTVTLDNSTVAIQLTYQEDPIENATVEVNGEAAGTTDANGEAVASIDPDSEEVGVDIERGEFEAESTYMMQNESLTQTALELEFRDREYESEDEQEDEEEEDEAEDERDEDEEESEDDEADESEDEEEDEEETESEDDESDEEDDEEAEETDESDDDDDDEEDDVDDDEEEDDEEDDEEDEEEDGY